MEFELRNTNVIGNVKTINEETSAILVNIVVGPVGCPYLDMVSNQMVEYVFSNDLTITEAKNGIAAFAANWVAANYPTI
jgi:hypothetical protein